MNRNIVSTLALLFLCAATLVAADPFTGAWKLNIPKTGSDVFPGPTPFNKQFRIEDLGQNRYQFTAGDGQASFTLTCTLSVDGTTLTCTEQNPDRPMVLRRVGGGTGFPGLWEGIDIVISPWRGDGLTFYWPSLHYFLNIRFDGNNWPGTGWDGSASVSTGRRLNQNTLEVTDSEASRVVRRTTYTVLPDGKEMTLTSHEMNQTDGLPDATFIAFYDKK